MRHYAKTPTIFQMEATECGAASLSMIFAYYGKHIPLEKMRVETGVSRDGCVAGNIMRAAKKYGFECHGYRKELDGLKKLPVPSIIHWNFNHFVVFEGIRGKYAYLNDPAVGHRKLTIQELDEGFTGVVLTFAPTASFQKERKQGTFLPFLRRRLHGRAGVLFKLVYVGLLLFFPGLILPALSQAFIDDVLCNGYKDWLTKILIFMGGCIVFKFGLSYYRGLLLQKLKSVMCTLSGRQFLSHMFRLPISFFDQRYTGDLVSRIQNNTQVDEFLAGDFAETFLNILIAVFYLVILFLYSWQMTLVGVAQIVICTVIVLIGNKTVAESTIKMQMTGGKLYGALCAGLSITDTIKASGVETEYSARILGHQAKNVALEQRLSRFQQLVGGIPEAIGKLADVALLLLGGFLVIRGDMTVGTLTAYNALFDSFCAPINSVVGFFRSLQVTKSNIQRVEDIEKHEIDPCYQVGEQAGHARGKLSGEVALRDVSFGYSRLKPPLIENFHFTLHSGDAIAFIGASGSGKSTISKVISGLYQPWGGQVLFDGKPADSIPKSVMNASVSTVSQKITLFSGTIRDNLSMWNPAVTQEDMEQAARDACIYDFILRQPGGFNYELTENAANLSGGQRQRMEIARALATNPTILVMDEATSALDPIVEKQVLDNIRARGCTCIVVAHRLSAVRDCNEIIAMANGKIIQRGSHRELMQQEGFYRSFANA